MTASELTRYGCHGCGFVTVARSVREASETMVLHMEYVHPGDPQAWVKK